MDKIEGENELEALDSSDPMEIFNDNVPSLHNVPIRSVEKVTFGASNKIASCFF